MQNSVEFHMQCAKTRFANVDERYRLKVTTSPNYSELYLFKEKLNN
jgi:hypothetical protein